MSAASESIGCFGEGFPQTQKASVDGAPQRRVENRSTPCVYDPEQPLDVAILVCKKINETAQIFKDYGRSPYNLLPHLLYADDRRAPLPLARRLVWWLLHNGNPKLWNQKALARQYGVTRPCICYGLKRITDLQNRPATDSHRKLLQDIRCELDLDYAALREGQEGA